jgi:BON domain-containing protein
VQLRGFVPSQADMDKVVQVARGLAGVKSVKADRPVTISPVASVLMPWAVIALVRVETTRL